VNPATVYALFAVLSYFMGAVPSGYLIARARGVDIRRVGSRNIGATNVFRSLGKPWGVLTFIADALKGFIPAVLFPVAARGLFGGEAGSGLAILCAMFAIAGHNWPVYLGFKGGKGVATSAGGLLGIAPAAVGIGLVIWTAVFLLSRYVSVASLAVAAAIPVLGWLFYAREGRLLPAVLTLLGVVIILRHHGNIRRLIQGTEHRFTFRKEPAADTKGPGQNTARHPDGK
jgi:glycerol-3-phosphate acyltransferase PlsY